MNNQTLVIYDLKILYEVLNETKNYINFNLINVDKNEIYSSNIKNLEDYLIISSKKINGFDNQMIINDFPIQLPKLVENININFLKKKYNQQSEIMLGNYKLNLNSRRISNNNKSLDLTERETNIIIFLKNSKKPVNVDKLQTEVWGHNLKLETHTVETHIYRLRKKINNLFHDKDFIKSSKSGYII
tara:strand:+ start:1785 stop:2345 length:561 start_codon:yes stop_codon:yes gene_type:complete